MHRLSLLVATLALVAMTGLAFGGDWPQWRGPQRTGVCESSPPLADLWPVGGPKKLWESEKIPAGSAGGLGSVVVAGGKAFVIATIRFNVPIETRKLADQPLRQLGWFPEKLPEDLSKTVEEARTSNQRADLKQNDVGKWVDQWLKDKLADAALAKQVGPQVQQRLGNKATTQAVAALEKLAGIKDSDFATPADVAKWFKDNGFPDDLKNRVLGAIATVKAIARDRLTRGAGALDLALLDKLATIKDKEFATQADIDKWFEENGVAGELKKKVMGVIATTKQEAKDHVYCLNAADGKTIWHKEYPGHPHDYGASSTPCVANGRVYVMGSLTDAYCLKVEDGSEVWTAKCGGGEKNSSFLALDGKAIVQAGPLLALDADTGKVAWTQPKVSTNTNSPVTWAKEGKTYLICNTGGGVSCVDPVDGKILWTAPGGSNSTAGIDGDTIAILSDDGKVGLTAYKISLEKAEKLWGINGPPAKPATTPAANPQPKQPPPAMVDRGASPIIHKGYVYVTAGGYSACVKLDGGEIAWRQGTPTQEISSPVLADGKLLCLGTEGQFLIQIQADPAKFNLMTKTKMGIVTCSSPAIVDGRLYVRGNNAVLCYDLTAAANPASAPAE